MGFAKARPQQAAIKMSMYGPPGSGKTATALLFAEGLAARDGKRIAFVDTERGTDFYALANPARKYHPDAFDFDALYTRSLTEALAAVRGLKPETHGVIVIDSISHLWESAVAAYRGKTHGGKIPFHAWGGIKKPYKELMAFLINSPYHVLILGRQGSEFAEDEDGETKAVGVKMKAEGETQYEPTVCARMESVASGKKGRSEGVVTLYGEKDRSSVIQGRHIQWPTYESVVAPMLGLLGREQASVPDDEEAAARDAEELARQRREKVRVSAIERDRLHAKLANPQTPKDVQAVRAEAEAVKARLLPPDLAFIIGACKAAYDTFLNPPAKNGPAGNGADPRDAADEAEERKAMQAEGKR